MKRYALILALLLLGGFVMVEVIQEEFGGGADGPSSDDVDLLAVDGPDAKGAVLKARGSKKLDGADPTEEKVEIDLFSEMPAEVRGGTKNGGSVRGRVVRKRGGVPLAGVRVTLGRFDSLISYLGAQANGRFDELEARTGSDGRFAFLDVTPSKGYVVRARHADYAIASSDDDLDLTGRDALDVGDLKLGSGATLLGRVVDQAGAPMAGIRIAATWRISNPLGIILADPSTAPEIEREVTTEADGRFRFERLDPQPKTIFAVAPDGAADVVRSVSLADGETKTVDDIRLPSGGVLAGRVLWADGTPVSEARVYAAPKMQSAVRTVETDAKGAFRITSLPEGEDYVVGVLVAGLPVSLTMGLSLGDEDVRIEFPMPGGIRGVVVTADSGDSLAGFALQLDEQIPDPDWQMRFIKEQVKKGLGPQPFVSSQGGAFTFPRVAVGTYKITASAAGFPAVTVEGVVVVAGESAEVRIEMAGGHVGRGRVRQSNGEPFVGARVHVVRGVRLESQGLDLQPYIRNREPDAVTEADGSFVLPPQTPGRYDLIAAHPKVLHGVLRGVDLKAGDATDLEILLPPSGAVRGRLLDEAARPLKGETVYVIGRDGTVQGTETGADGRFELAGLPVGRCLVRWISLLDGPVFRRVIYAREDPERRRKAYDELRETHGEHHLRDGAVVEVTIRIPSRTVVTGRYRIAGNPPGERQRVFYVTSDGSGKYVDVNLDADGAFEIRLVPGSYVIYGPGTGAGYSESELIVPNAATHTVDIEVP